jgi:hypothetical protein
MAGWSKSRRPARRQCATALLNVAGLIVAAAARTPPASPATERMVVAGTELPFLGNTPLNEPSALQAPLTAEDVVRRIAVECASVDERGALSAFG